MSYNIDSSDYVSGKLYIDAKVAKELRKKYKRDIPEGNFLDNLDDEAEGNLEIKFPWWYSEGSGSSFETLKEILRHTTGKASILFVWEGGDSQTALIVNEGVVKDGKVKITVEEEDG